MTALLNAKLRLIDYHIASVGSLSEAIAPPREIYRATILAGAYAHVVMHIMEISLLDHVIVGVPEAGCAPYFSFREVGLL